MSQPLTIGLGLVSWKSHETFAATLRSHQQAELFSQVDRSLIWFQDLSDEDKTLASEFEIPCDGGPNVGIAEGYANLAERLQTDLILLSENDCPSVETTQEISFQLERARRLFANDSCDILRLRHRWKVGEGFNYGKYLAYHPVHQLHPELQHQQELPCENPALQTLRRLLKPSRAHNLKGRALYLEAKPEQIFPEAIARKEGEEELFLTDSRFLNWTNQSVLVRRSFFLKTLMPYVRENPSSRTSNGFQSPERPLNSPWWRNQKFRIAVGRGLFGHQRVDGSWRPQHHTNQAPDKS
jgi:hypothetical protein